MGEKKHIAYKVSLKNMSRNIYAGFRVTVVKTRNAPKVSEYSHGL